ncbi:hypothetical protein [Clostridium porci]|uniref:Uncharacterized protein n=1 Tax=Clostridium porci TaxID=2605778 RepID=A0A7X2NKS5_9CLOT|nr:hypothetical protein [Clostridium porci]MSS36501.1 hypothetical protein [Clostridium porci]
MTMHEYFAERGFENVSKLKQYDAYDKPIPIGYTKGCTRHLVKALSKPEVKMQPEFGHIYALPQYEALVRGCVETYQAILAHDLLYSVFENDAPALLEGADLDHISPELAHEILTRFYPSDYHWLHDREGAIPAESGYVTPVQHSSYMDGLLHDAEYRKEAFGINCAESMTDDSAEYTTEATTEDAERVDEYASPIDADDDEAWM